jgi:hypothetical protein
MAHRARRIRQQSRILAAVHLLVGLASPTLSAQLALEIETATVQDPSVVAFGWPADQIVPGRPYRRGVR